MPWRRKRPGMLSHGVVPLTRQYPYCSQDSRIASKFQVGDLEHPYSQDLATNLGSKNLSAKRFSSDSDVKTDKDDGHERDFYQSGLNKLVLRSDKRLDRFGDDVER
ncbi:hypothetical protein AVEN_109799-1 [Araneus ventricosus]|uniref:Uncharacterized protein n=1 Tax=Araneus ventricosus TaxID=182803 RepID=A0A4Y2KGG4_ARAVE|nr:hypothetical protein AVEN_109799-1 [Araneus ventricosus]